MVTERSNVKHRNYGWPLVFPTCAGCGSNVIAEWDSFEDEVYGEIRYGLCTSCAASKRACRPR
jgi:hypothetical protein